MTIDSSPNMDEKAANQGDRLKHALLLEVLQRTCNWPSVAYAETHAGAGVYCAKGQSEKHPYIQDLQSIVTRQRPPAKEDEPGAAYLKWLKEWWHVPANDGLYPGSAVTALRWLRGHRTPSQFDVLVIEKSETSFSRLRDALGAGSFRAERGSFTNFLDQLTAPDGLVLLIDPFACVTRFENATRECGLNKGWIDHETVRDVLGRCAQKQRAVVGFWWSSAQNLRTHHGPTSRLLREWCADHDSRAYREFHDGRANHKCGLVGIGVGAQIVRYVPTRNHWKGSWLRNVIYEKRASPTTGRIHSE